MAAFLIVHLPCHPKSLEAVEFMQKNDFFYRISTNIPLMSYAMSSGVGENHQLKEAMGLSTDFELGQEELRILGQLTNIFPSEPKIKTEEDSWDNSLSNENVAPKECVVKVESEVLTTGQSNKRRFHSKANLAPVKPMETLVAPQNVSVGAEEIAVQAVFEVDDPRMEVEDTAIDELLEPLDTGDSMMSRAPLHNDELEEDLLDEVFDSRDDEDREEVEEKEEEEEHEEKNSDEDEWVDEEESSEEEEGEVDSEEDSDEEDEKGHRAPQSQKNEDDEWEEEVWHSDEEEEKNSEDHGHKIRNSQKNKRNRSSEIPVRRRLFVCPVKNCTSSFCAFEGLTVHMEKHQGNLDLSCDACKKSFSTEDDAMAHIQERQKMACCACGRKFSRPADLARHLLSSVQNYDEKTKRCTLRSSITVGRLLYTCPVKNCPSSFKDFKQLEEHIKAHDGQQDFFCDVCKKNFTTEASALTHIRQRGSLECCSCGVKSTMKSNMVMHLRCHTGEKPFVCKTCGKGFTNAHHLKDHMTSHTGEKSLSCRFCEKRFALKHHLETHERTHTGEKPFECNQCDYRSNDRSHLKTHMRTHSGEKPYACECCEKRFSSKANLRNHERRHADEKPFECSHCGHRFKDKSDLKKHSRIHTGEKPYSCKKCDKKFARSSDLNVHMRRHTGEKPFSCQKCGKKFTVSGNLKIHMERIHKA